MKKILLTFSIIVGIAQLSYAQPFAPLQNIDPNTGQEPYEIASGDLDGDGDIDVVMATYDFNGGTPLQDYIKWYSNDGLGNFTVEPTISSTIRWVDGLLVADIDGQFGLDIVATSASQNKLVYYLSDGSGGFGSEIIVDADLGGPGQVVAGDINNDGHLDLASMSFNDNRTVWYSGDGTGEFNTEPDIENGTTDGPYYIDLADLDNDGDLDAVVAFVTSQSIEIFYNQFIESGTNTVSWIKDAVSVSTDNEFLFDLSVADVNNDGVLNIVKVDFTSGDVAFYDKVKNGASNEIIISDETIINNPARAFVVDLDNDSFNDVIVTDGGVMDDAIIYFKGAANASPDTDDILIVNNNFIIYDIAVADFDNDGDKDIATISNVSDRVDWFENQLITLNIPEVNNQIIKMYPNPTDGDLFFSGITEPVLVTIYDSLGREILTDAVEQEKSMDVSMLKTGMYFLNFEGNSTTFKFIKN